MATIAQTATTVSPDARGRDTGAIVAEMPDSATATVPSAADAEVAVARLTSMSADRAADRIVSATRRREGEVVLSWQANVLRLVHDLFPNLALRMNTFANGLMPHDNRGERHHVTRGKDVTPSPVTSALTENMNTAAKQLNQLDVDRQSPRHPGTR